MTDEQLLTGLENAKNHKGWLTIGGFRGLCEKPEVAPYHRPYNPNQLEHKGMTPEARKAAMKKLREEVGI